MSSSRLCNTCGIEPKYKNRGQCYDCAMKTKREKYGIVKRVTTDICVICGIRPKHPNRGRCIECYREYALDYWHKNQVSAKYWARAKEDPVLYEKLKARWTVNQKLTAPEKCQICDCSGPLEAHHHDYSKPLDVVWLCKPCHYGVTKDARPKP